MDSIKIFYSDFNGPLIVNRTCKHRLNVIKNNDNVGTYFYKSKGKNLNTTIDLIQPAAAKIPKYITIVPCKPSAMSTTPAKPQCPG